MVFPIFIDRCLTDDSLQQHHLDRPCILRRYQAGDVDAGGDVAATLIAAIPLSLMIACHHVAIHQPRYLPAQDVIDDQTNIGPGRAD